MKLPWNLTRKLTEDVLPWAPFGSGTAVSTGNGTVGYPITSKHAGMRVRDVLITVHDKGITGATQVQLRRRRAGADTDLLSTLVTLGDEFYVADGVVNGAASVLALGDILYCDVDAVHSGTAPNGLGVGVVVSK
jgi:hypothetical protein